MKKPEPTWPTWLVCVWDADGFRFYQVDMVGADGHNAGSISPKELRAQGYDLPDFSTKPHGQYRMAEFN